MPNLTPKQLRFIDEYLIDLNATQAAIRAGYSKNTAKQIGSENLTKPDISLEIANRGRQVTQSTGITIERTLQELGRLAFSDVRKLYNADGSLKSIVDLDDDAAAMLGGVDVVEMQGAAEIDGEGNIKHVPMYTKKVKIWDKNSALEKAMKYLQLLQPEKEPGGLEIKFDFAENKLEGARRIAFMLSLGSGKVIEGKK